MFRNKEAENQAIIGTQLVIRASEDSRYFMACGNCFRVLPGT
ncbi:hypothetical protein [Microvirga sp. VF16]|nr:hypothetical protein [Microvirga sp. VF16]